MFGIGLPELIVILGLALIVVGPDKLPDLARSIAKGILELKKTAEGLKDELTQEGGMLEDLRPEIDAVKTLKKELSETVNLDWQNDKPFDTPYTVKDTPDTAPASNSEQETDSGQEQPGNPEAPAKKDSSSTDTAPVSSNEQEMGPLQEQSAVPEAPENEDSSSADTDKKTSIDEKHIDDAGKKP